MSAALKWPIQFALCLLGLMACNGQKQAATAHQQPKSEAATVVATIERTACYGQCPIYKATFYSDGSVRYLGKRFVPNMGTYTVQISKEAISTIVTEAEKYGYFEMNDRYDSPVTDFPSCQTSVTRAGKTKSIYNRADGPKSLKGFEKYLESLIDGKEFVKVSEESY